MPAFKRKSAAAMTQTSAACKAGLLSGTREFVPTATGLSDRVIGWAFIAPAVALMIFVLVFPLLWTLLMSLTIPASHAPAAEDFLTYVSTLQWAGSKYYQGLVTGTAFWQILTITAKFAICSVILPTTIGFALAGRINDYLINRRIKTANFWLVIIALPMMLTPVLAPTIWSLMLPTNGPTLGVIALANQAAQVIANFLGATWANGGNFTAETATFWSATLTQTWILSPLVMLICLAGYRTIPDAIYLAAGGDRVSPRQQFWALTFPMVKPFVVLAGLICLLASLILFDLAYAAALMTGAEPLRPASVYLASDLAGNGPTNDYDLAGQRAAFSVLHSVIIIILALVFVRLLKKRKLINPPPGPPDIGSGNQLQFQLPPEANIKKSKLKILGHGMVMVYAILAITPLLWLIWATFSPLLAGKSLAFGELATHFASPAGTIPVNGPLRVISGISGSATIAFVASLLSVGLGTLAGYGYSRRSKRRGLELGHEPALLSLMLAAHFLTPVLIAAPLFDFFGQTFSAAGWSLIALYTALNLPLAIWLMKSFFDEIPPEWEDVAISESYSRLQVFKKVALPLVRPGIVITGLFCFLLSWNDLTLIHSLLPSAPLTAATPDAISPSAATGKVAADTGDLEALATLLLVLPCLLLTIGLRPHLMRFATFGMVSK